MTWQAAVPLKEEKQRRSENERKPRGWVEVKSDEEDTFRFQKWEKETAQEETEYLVYACHKNASEHVQYTQHYCATDSFPPCESTHSLNNKGT